MAAETKTYDETVQYIADQYNRGREEVLALGPDTDKGRMLRGGLDYKTEALMRMAAFVYGKDHFQVINDVPFRKD